MSVSAIFYVMVTKKEYSRNTYASKEYSCHPVFRCKKCDNDSDTRNCCMIYVDEVGRVYQNWKSYINENVLPAGIMVAPPNGIYNFNQFDEVILEAHFTPNGKPEAEALRSMQNKSSVLGLGAACVPVAALVLPVAAPIMTMAGLIGLGVGAFSAATSVAHLKDRKQHSQSISLDNREARSCYLGIVAGGVGVASAGATRVMTSMASAGKATKGIEVLVNGMNISSLALSGSGVVNGIFDLLFKLNDGDEISSMDLLQLSASLVLFTNSLHNFQLASHIANNARNNSIKSYRDTLSNRQRKMFDKMSKETMRIRGGTQGKIDIIRGVNEIPDRQYLNDLFKINKQLNQQKVRPSFGGSGNGIVINNEVKVNAAELRQSVQHQRGPNILKQVTQPIPSNHNSDTYTTQTPKSVGLFFSNGIEARSLDIAANEDNWATSLSDMRLYLQNGATIILEHLSKNFLRKVSDFNKFQDVISCMFENLAEDAAKFILTLAHKFIEELKQEIESVIKISISTESVLYHMLTNILNKYQDLCKQFLAQKAAQIMKDARMYFLRFNTNDPNGRNIKCTDCSGRMTISG